MDLEKWENRIKRAEELNRELVLKNIRFFVWLFVNSVLFLLVSYGFLRAYDVIGFEKTLLLLGVMFLLSNLRESYKKV
jgi:hypothetical protein